MTVELWAGAECTVNRVGDRWFDQVLRTGHHDRIEDIDRIAALGVTRLRFPVLWERVAGRGLAHADWRWSDERLERLDRLGIVPIVGLVHHGSGPAGTHLCDRGFVDKLAAFAEAVARRYPSVQQWTPINEPLTTARFAALYGHWYPHQRDMSTCLSALLIEVRAIAASMARIRSIIPGAELIQTEDLGRVQGTAELGYQIEYESHRRWLGFDLLAGRVDSAHPLREHCEGHGLDPAELDALVREPCMPDVIGINYYLTSDRFLDHRIESYPAHVIGGNARQRYADVEAVRVAGVRVTGHRALIEETWQRYGQPVALTEVHLGCTREEQIRWLREAWSAAVESSAAGIDVRGVTLWSLFGAVDWHCLVTREDGHYEPGVFDVRAPEPRPTAIAVLARQLAQGTAIEHPVLTEPGWWHQPSSRIYRNVDALVVPQPPSAARPLLIAGAMPLADRMVARCRVRGIAYVHVTQLGDAARVLGTAPATRSRAPWAVVAIEDLGARPRSATAVSTLVGLARSCSASGIPFVSFSSDRVFSAAGTRPYLESDPACPDCDHGHARHRLDRDLLAAAPEALLVRVGVLLDPDDPVDPMTRILVALEAGARMRLPDDEVVSLSYVPHLVDATLDLLIDGDRGIWHGTNMGTASLFELARRAVEHAGIGGDRLTVGAGRHPWGPQPRPGMRAIASERAWPMPALDVALADHIGVAMQARRSTRSRGATTAA